MPKVLLSLPRLGVTGRGPEKNKEIYVLSFACDLNKPNVPKVPEIIAAYNETLPNVAPAIQNESALRYVLVSVSNTFSRIRSDQPVSLSGSGIILYPHIDPGGLLASHFAIIESDRGHRDIGKMLSRLFADEKVSSLVQALSQNMTQPALALLMNALISQVPRLLKKNKDDLLFSHSHSGFDFDKYGCDPDKNFTDFELKNDMAYCTLRVRVTEDQ